PISDHHHDQYGQRHQDRLCREITMTHRQPRRVAARLILFALAFTLAAPLVSSGQATAPADLAWPPVTVITKPWTRWWWPGSAVDKENLTAQLTAFRDDGLGGVEITPIYGAKGYESRFIPFLSPAYVEMLGYASSEAHRLGLGADMSTTTGWPFGGPWV